jgi:hypothetical protein
MTVEKKLAEPDIFVKEISTALKALTTLLQASTIENQMDEYEKQITAIAGIKALTKLIDKCY